MNAATGYDSAAEQTDGDARRDAVERHVVHAAARQRHRRQQERHLRLSRDLFASRTRRQQRPLHRSPA